jgi:prepilin-type N-terminal cleavage/methylation domain-containing protein
MNRNVASSSTGTGRRRRGFTLVELLVVVSILLVLASFVALAFNGNTTDKMRSAARITQSAFLGAKDRALHAKEVRGIRLIRDQNNANIFTGFAYLQQLPTQTLGNVPGKTAEYNFAVARDNNGNANIVQISGTRGATLFSQDSNGIWAPYGVRVRIPAQSGQWYYLLANSTNAPFWGQMNSGVLTLTLQTGYQGGKPPNAVTGATNAIDTTDANASCDIQIGNELLPFHQAINLPSGVVIDLNYCSQNVQNLSNTWSMVDIPFSPRGGVSSYLAALGPMHFCLRDIRDVTQNLSPSSQSVRGECLIVTLFPQSGLVQTFEANLTDVLNNTTGNPGADGQPDNLYSFAIQGSTAGR